MVVHSTGAAADVSIPAIREYQRSGIRHGHPEKLWSGSETEFFLVELGADGYYTRASRESVDPILRAIIDGREMGECSHVNDGPLVRKIKTRSGLITFEPGGQIEWSGVPHPTIGASVRDLQHFVRTFNTHARGSNIKLATTGIDPLLIRRLEELDFEAPRDRDAARNSIVREYLNPLPRTKIMAAYSERIGNTIGNMMMAGSCATQVTVNARDERELAEQFAVFHWWGSVTAAMCSNSPYGEFASKRTALWLAGEPRRCGPVVIQSDEDVPTAEDIARSYAELPMMYYPGRGDKYEPMYGKLLAGLNVPLTPKVIAAHIASNWSFVRAGPRVEARAADSVPVTGDFPVSAMYHAEMAVLALSPGAREAALKLLPRRENRPPVELIAQVVSRDGLRGTIPMGTSTFDIREKAEALLEIALDYVDQVDETARDYLLAAGSAVSAREMPSDVVKKAAGKSSDALYGQRLIEASLV